MLVLRWVVENWELAVFVLLSAALLAFQGWERTKALAYQLMLEAEKLMAEELLGSGPEKMRYVVMGLHEMLPVQVKGAVKVFAALRGQTTKELLHDLAQWLYDRMKEVIEES